MPASMDTESEQELGWLSYHSGAFHISKGLEQYVLGTALSKPLKTKSPQQMVTIPFFSKCESEGRYKNFERAAHPSDSYDVGKLMPYSFDDTDPYKTIEGCQLRAPDLS